MWVHACHLPEQRRDGVDISDEHGNLTDADGEGEGGSEATLVLDFN